MGMFTGVRNRGVEELVMGLSCRYLIMDLYGQSGMQPFKWLWIYCQGFEIYVCFKMTPMKMILFVSIGELHSKN